jgi:hypothetical protein
MWRINYDEAISTDDDRRRDQIEVEFHLEAHTS